MSRIGFSVCGYASDVDGGLAITQPTVVDKYGAWFPVNATTPTADPQPATTETPNFSTQYPILQADWKKAVEWKWRVKTWNVSIQGVIDWKSFILYIGDFGNVLARQISVDISQDFSIGATSETQLVINANGVCTVRGEVDVSAAIAWEHFEVNDTPAGPPPPFTGFHDDPSAGGAISATLRYAFYAYIADTETTRAHLLTGDDLLVPMEMSLVISYTDAFLGKTFQIVLVTADNGASGAYSGSWNYTGATIEQGTGTLDGKSFQYRGLFAFGTQVLDSQSLMSDEQSDNPTLSQPADAPTLWVDNPVFDLTATITPKEWWSYDGVWNTATGAQLITPIPQGL